MSPGSSESLALSIPPCTSNGTTSANGTCADPTDPLFRSFSSTMVLLVLLSMIAGTILVSLATFHLHKSKMRKRKIQRAQEEYERDSGRPKAVRGKPAIRHCVMERPTAVQKSDVNARRSDQEAAEDAGIPEIKCADTTRHTSQTHGDHLLESVAVS
ncbi:uncharacterized protein C11orf87 homolog [Silurus meridionalis]|uniref:Uncharacterized protein n=1 Tax=Silurus meridionalis TaxID=175797 RepID=A0A8T0B6Z9_SILME|nr:uncharacterized protein C11orf87 homolog [Silurus meridionalis]XP_046719106.1 uncharacterized protein C11orf87 homolog [Silurus meridionalis]XP_046719107.1 uncharacterized protein C11orf87 homolog [Silurus meridionalis]XP_046719108.1 uncharacterized protein C11orf87 homolog [Silurus meridionalis]KAF7700126.1 hypothetical protein HF521_003084 [Silurus meridionalis]KAI5099022.1 hypothetical protein C0J45_11161 [Silurus meridionalis]